MAGVTAVAGGGLIAAGMPYDGIGATYAVIGGGLGLVFSGLYLLSPAWGLVVMLDDQGFEVSRRGRLRFRLLWADVVSVTASPDTKTCFVDGGKPERSLLVPGPGASAPYDIENKAALYDAIMARVPPERVIEVALLETARQQSAAAGTDATAGTDAAAAGDAPAPAAAPPAAPATPAGTATGAGNASTAAPARSAEPGADSNPEPSTDAGTGSDIGSDTGKDVQS